MMITIQLPDEVGTILQRRAAAAEMELSAYVVELLVQSLAKSDPASRGLSKRASYGKETG